MEEGGAKASGGSGWLRSRTGTMVVTAAAVATVFSLILVVVMSPSMSPLASIRDTDGDGYPDSVDEFPDDLDEWSDIDGDGYGDNSDAFPNDASEHQDTDGDGVGDNSDAFPEDPDEWADSDGDGYGDNSDLFPEDMYRNSPAVAFLGSVPSCSIARAVIMNVSPPVSWDDVSASVADGSDSQTWPLDSDGLDTGEYESLVIGTADLNGVLIQLTVVDFTGDGTAFTGDSVEVRAFGNGFSLGEQYTIALRYLPTGTCMGSYTFSAPSTPPTLEMTAVEIAGGYRAVLGYISVSEMLWDAVSVELTDGTHVASWTNITYSDLDDGVADLKDYGSAAFGSLSVRLRVMDLSGNGELNQGDYLELTADSFAVGTEYTLMILHTPQGVCGSVVLYEPEPQDTPVTTLSKVAITGGWRFTFGWVSEDVSWDHITVTIISGANVWTWNNLTAADLDGDVAIMKNYGDSTTGALTVTLKVLDLSGNGKVNGGDYIELTSIPDFSASTDYTLYIMFEPTDEPMASTTFTG